MRRRKVLEISIMVSFQHSYQEFLKLNGQKFKVTRIIPGSHNGLK